MARLKVFTSLQGFYETVVAAASQKAALEAWGTHQNLFADAMAAVAKDPQAIEAALARPGEVLQRPAGGKGPFAPVGQADLPSVPVIARPTGAAATTKARAQPKPAPDRTALNQAEKALAYAVQRQSDEQAEIDKARAALDTREFELRQSSRDEQKALKAAVDRARRTFEKAGGGA